MKIHGQIVSVGARIARNDSMSAHRSERDSAVAGGCPAAPRRLFLVHGEPMPMDALKQRVQEHFGWDAATPALREAVALADEQRGSSSPRVVAVASSAGYQPNQSGAGALAGGRRRDRRSDGVNPIESG